MSKSVSWLILPRESGICPFKLFSERIKLVSFARFEIDEGIWPLKLLDEKSKSVICVRLQREAGMDLEKLHWERYKLFKALRLLLQSGSWPEKLVQERSRNWRELVTLKFGSFPVSLILARKLSFCRFGRWKMFSENFPCRWQ